VRVVHKQKKSDSNAHQSLTKGGNDVVGLIPARYESSRFPGKPLALLGGKPIIQHVVERACRTACLSKVVVATDSEEIAMAVQGFGGSWVMTGSHHRCGTDRLSEAANLLKLGDDDIVVNIQGDQPLFNPEIVALIVSLLHADPGIVMTTAVFKVVREQEIGDPNHVKSIIDRRGNALYFSRSTIPYVRNGSDSKPDYFKHLGFYGYRKHFLDTFASLPEGEWERCEKLEQLRALEHGYPIKVVISEHDSIEIDTQQELERAGEILMADHCLRS
jgi:3-deoxy-manno-octulosonate cytidylyltransferase (CMP-KDO synthetase)